MKSFVRSLSLLGAAALLAVLVGCAHEAPKQGTLLTRAGFRLFSADDAAKVALLRTLPPATLTPVTSHRRIYFVMPDPRVEARLYAGGRQELAAYQRLRGWRKLPPEEISAAALANPADWTGWRGLNDGWYTFSNPRFFGPSASIETQNSTVGEKP